CVDAPLALAADPDFATVAENLVADAGLCPAFRTHQLDVGRVQRRFTLDDAALDVLAGVRLRVALDHVHAFDDQAVLLREHLQHTAALAAVFAGDDEDAVVLA